MKNHHRFAAAAAAAAILLSGAGCASDPAEPSAETATDAKLNPAGATEAAVAFFNEATADDVAAAFPDKADSKTFSDAVDMTDPGAAKDDVSAAITDLAWLKVENPKAKLVIAVDEAKVKVEDKKASIPADAVAITLDGKAVADNAKLAAHLTDLVFKDGTWLVAFPAEAEPTESATPAASPSASPSPTKK